MIEKILFTVLIFMNVSSLKFSNDTDDYLPVISSCDTYLESFADAASNMTYCLVKHSRVFKVCMSCLEEYLTCNETYNILMNTTTGDGKVSCSKSVANGEHVQMIVELHNFITDAWDRNFCSSCYDDLTSGTLSNKTKEFMERLHTFYKCIYDDLGSHLPYIIPGPLPVNKTICTKCLTSYKNLSDFYLTLDPLFTGKFCMDLSDSMNFTWKAWHENFECYLHYRSLDVCLGTSLFIALFPAIFYFLAKICSSDITRIFLREKRLQETIITTTVTTSSEN